MLTIIYYILLFAVTVLFFVIICVAWALTAAFDRDRVVLHWLSRLWTRCYFGMFPSWRRRVGGKENIKKGQPYVVVVNHSSMLDIPLMYVLPFNFKWVSKREVYKWPMFGWVLRMHGDIAIERGSSKSLRQMMEGGKKNLSRGISVIIFPEGTRSKDGQLGRFREGAFLLAKEAGVPVLPCVTTGTDTAIKGWKLNFRNRFRVNVLPPVSVGELRSADIKELASRTRGQMNAEHEKMKNENK